MHIEGKAIEILSDGIDEISKSLQKIEENTMNYENMAKSLELIADNTGAYKEYVNQIKWLNESQIRIEARIAPMEENMKDFKEFKKDVIKKMDSTKNWIIMNLVGTLIAYYFFTNR